MIKACELRRGEVLSTVPSDKPGYYKWWAEESEFRFLVEKLGADFNECVERAEKKDGLFCIYIGIVWGRSLRKRIYDHVMEKNSLPSIKHGGLSTFRQTISSVVAGDQSDQRSTDDFIGKLYVEWFPVDLPVSGESRKAIEDIETKVINEHFRILNSSKNHDELFKKKIRRKLTAVRNDAKTKALSRVFPVSPDGVD